MYLDVWPKTSTVIDFGINSDRHLGALQYAIRYGEVTLQELDAAMGSGTKLTEIAQRGNNPYQNVMFRITVDEIYLGPEYETGHNSKDLFEEIRADEQAARVRDYGAAGQPGLLERTLFGYPSTATPEPDHAETSREKDRADEEREI